MPYSPHHALDWRIEIRRDGSAVEAENLTTGEIREVRIDTGRTIESALRAIGRSIDVDLLNGMDATADHRDACRQGR